MKEIKPIFSYFFYLCEKPISCMLIVSKMSSELSSFYPGNHGLRMFFIPCRMGLLLAVTSQDHCERQNNASSQETTLLQPLQVLGRLWRPLGVEKGQLEVAPHSSTLLPVNPTIPPREQKCLLGVKDFPKGKEGNRWEATARMCMVRE